MEEDNKKNITFSYHNTFKDENDDYEKNIIIRVEYRSKTKVDNEKRLEIRESLNNYFNNVFDYKKDSIFDIINSVREITEYLQEGKLDVFVNRYYDGEYVQYKNGNPVVSGAYIEYDDDNRIIVHYKNKNIEIEFKKEDFLFNRREHIKQFNIILNKLASTVVTLNGMTKNNNELELDQNTMKLKNKESK